MRSSDLWRSFDETYCLTLAGDAERQLHASAELQRVGLGGFEFVEGVAADSEKVEAAYREGRVKTFPPCFRCSSLRCDNPDCNNILIEPQVACFLSFIDIFKRAAQSASKTFLVVEDDISFLGHYEHLASVALTPQALAPLGFFEEAPCLIGLGRGASPHEAFTSVAEHRFIARRKMPQNPCFAFNRSFAELALTRFHNIYHTADVFIHFDISDQANHYSLEPPLASELSTSTGALPSRIHPKLIAAQNEDNTVEARERARAALSLHLKRVHVTPLLVLGSPGGGMEGVARALGAFGLDVGHECVGADGIGSWLFAVDDVDLPVGTGQLGRNSRFVYPEKTIAVLEAAPQAVFSIQVEDARDIRSHVFRRRWIKTKLGIDIDSFPTAFERALASYTFWYRLIELKQPHAWVSLDRGPSDLLRLQRTGVIASRRTPELSEISGALGQAQPAADFEGAFELADRSLRDEYWKLRSDLFTVFNKPI
jgi:hypothetical protein